MIRILTEHDQYKGRGLGQGINFTWSDNDGHDAGGWWINIRLGRLAIYFRRRGPNNHAIPPRHIFEWDWLPCGFFK